MSLLGLVRYCLSSHISCCVPQQLSSRKNGEFRVHCVESSLGSLILSSAHSTIIITNMLINQTGSYYAITNFYLIWNRSQLYPITLMISLLLHLDFGSASVSCNHNNIILVTEHNLYVCICIYIYIYIYIYI